GETAAEAAIREIHEETGYMAQITGWAGTDEYTSDDGARIHTVFFIAEGSPSDDVQQHLESDTLLVSAHAAPDALDIPSLADLVRRTLPLFDAEAS
ncbi:MAG: NUDIX domain-containing protein, partial [Chloroflexota bacterium]